jgi:ADP-ribose pyrophosphatase
MPDIFLHEPYCARDIISRIIGGPDPAASSTPAVLPDHKVISDATDLRLLPVPASGNRLPGQVLALTDLQRDRLDFLMNVLGLCLAPVRVDADGTRIAAVAYFGDGAARLHPAGATPECRDEQHHLVLEAAGEVMEHFGTRDASEMRGLVKGIGIRALARARGRASHRPAGLSSGLGAGDVQAMEKTHPYINHFGVEEHRLRHRRFDGDMTEPIDRAVFASGDAVTVLPFDPVRGQVLLIEQFRAGAFARRDPHPWLLEAVAGRCDALETPQDTARREAREEAGIHIGRLERIARYYTSPGVMTEFITAFVGEADLSGAGGIHGLTEESEDIRVLVVSLSEALELIASGEANNAPLLISLQWLETHRDRLAASWRPGA